MKTIALLLSLISATSAFARPGPTGSNVTPIVFETLELETKIRLAFEQIVEVERDLADKKLKTRGIVYVLIPIMAYNALRFGANGLTKSGKHLPNFLTRSVGPSNYAAIGGAAGTAGTLAVFSLSPADIERLEARLLETRIHLDEAQSALKRLRSTRGID